MICFHQLFLCNHGCTMLNQSVRRVPFIEYYAAAGHASQLQGRKESILTTKTTQSPPPKAQNKWAFGPSEVSTQSRAKETNSLQTHGPWLSGSLTLQERRRTPLRAQGRHCDSTQGAHSADSLSQLDLPASFIFRLASVGGWCNKALTSFLKAMSFSMF